MISAIDPAALEALSDAHEVRYLPDPSREALAEALDRQEILIFRSGVTLDHETLSRGRNLGLLIRAGAGTDNIDLDYLREKALPLITIPEPGAHAVAEMAFALMLTASRNVALADRMLRRGEWAKNRLTGREIRGKVLGIFGAGNIGTEVGRLGTALGMEAIGCVATPTPEKARRLEMKGIRLAPADEVIARADFLSLHVPLTEATRGLIDAATLDRMKPGAYLINLARGGVVDEAALTRALESGHIAGAGIDVHEHEGASFESPLSTCENVVLTPHIGAGTKDAQGKIGARILELVSDYVAKRGDADV